MEYKTPEALRTALEQRLRNESEKSHVLLGRLRKQVVFGRFLARLLHVAPKRWVLKGAVALCNRYGNLKRTTDDIDLGSSEPRIFFDWIFADAARADLGDYFEFSIAGPKEVTHDAVAILRYNVEARLAGRVFDSYHVDVGVTEEPDFEPEMVPASSLLEFAGINSILVPTIPIADHVADKIHGYTRPRKSGENTRVKDLVDMTFLAATDHVLLDTERLATAVVSVFKREPSHEIPQELPEPPDSWRPIFRVQAEAAGIEKELQDIDRAFAIVREALNPVLVAAKERTRVESDQYGERCRGESKRCPSIADTCKCLS